MTRGDQYDRVQASIFKYLNPIQTKGVGADSAHHLRGST